MSNSKRTRGIARAITGAAALATLGAVALGGAPAAGADEKDEFAPIDPCDLRPTITWLQDYGDDTSKNIIVYNTEHEESAHFEGIVEDKTVTDEECGDNPWADDDFRYVVFTGKGEFDRKGDGGYGNWAFTGSYDMPADDRAEFHAR